jgi:hypothetical protein
MSQTPTGGWPRCSVCRLTIQYTRPRHCERADCGARGICDNCIHQHEREHAKLDAWTLNARGADAR